MTKSQLDNILAQAKRDVEAGELPREVSAELCKAHGLNWMFIAPMVQAFKK
jgi:hypothetical protein